MVLPFLREGLDRLQTRRPMSDDFNINLGFFLPRGDKAEDTVGVKRTADTCRPLSAKNTFNKILLGTMTNNRGEAAR